MNQIPTYSFLQTRRCYYRKDCTKHKLPVLNLLIGQKSSFSPHGGDLLHRFTWNMVWPTGTWVSLAVQNYTSIGAGGGNLAPKYKNVHFLVQDCPSWFLKVLGDFMRTIILQVFQIWRDSLHSSQSYCWETVDQSFRPNFSVHPVGKTIHWIEKWLHLFWWSRRLLSPCKVWGRSFNTLAQNVEAAEKMTRSGKI